MRLPNAVPAVPAAPASPFDRLRRVRPDGAEYWSARELAASLGYADGPAFRAVLRRVRAALRNLGHDPAAHVHPVGRPAADVELSRYAVSFVPMAADPTKPAVAALQTYLYEKTRQAERAAGPLRMAPPPAPALPAP